MYVCSVNPGVAHILSALLFAALAAFFILRFRPLQIQGAGKAGSLAVFLFKTALIFLFWAIYTYIYADPRYADIYKYFHDGEALYQYLYVNPQGFMNVFFGMENEADRLYMNAHTLNWYKPFEELPVNENRLIIRFHALLYPLSRGSYFAHAVVCSFMSYTGSLLLYKSWLPYFRNKAPLWFIAVFMLPSVLFWSAGVLKEPFVILGSGLLVYALFNEKRLLWLLPALLLILFSKEYVFAAFLPGVLAVLLARIPALKTRTILNQLIAWGAILLLAAAVSAWLPGYNLWHILHKKQEAFSNVSELMNARSRFQMPAFSADLPGVLLALPRAWANALFRPFAKDIYNAMTAVSFTETAAIWLFGIYCLSVRRTSKFSSQESRILWFCLSFVLMLAAIIGLTVDNSGALVRYRMPALPFLMAIFVLLLRKNITFKWFKV